MSSPESQTLNFTESLPIPELFKRIKHSFRECEFDDVQGMLMDREKKMKIEMENLVRDRDSFREKARLLERSQGLAELEKLKLEENLQKTERKCDEMKETITRLIEEHKASNDRGKRDEARYMKACEENSKMEFELNEKIKTNLENEQLLGVYHEKVQCLETKLTIMGHENEVLRQESLAAERTVEELRQKQLKADQVVEELKRQNLQATRTVDELKLRKLESDKASELSQRMHKNLVTRIKKVEETLANMLNVPVENLGDIVQDIDKDAAAKAGANMEFSDSTDEKDCLGNGVMQDEQSGDAEYMIPMLGGLHSTSNSPGSQCIGFSKGGRNLVQSYGVNEDGKNTVQICPGSQSGNTLPQAEINGADQNNGCEERWGSSVESKIPQSSGPHASAMHLDCGGKEGYSIKTAHSFSAAGDIIEICDSDDETNPGRPAYVPDIGANVGQKKMAFEKFDESSHCKQKNRQDRTDCKEESYRNLISKRKRSKCRSHEINLPVNDKENQVLKSTHDSQIRSLDNDFSAKPLPQTDPPPAALSSISCSAFRRCENTDGAACDSETPLQKLDGVKDGGGDSTDSEDASCTDSHMDDLIATLKSKNPGRKRMFGAQAFQQDAKFYMHAVCALYRQLQKENSAQGSKLSKNGVFSHFDTMSGRALAEYLIDGDPELKLKKSVLEVKEQHPDVLIQCKRLASIYSDELFEIYCSRKDPFFSQI